ncbi:MAG: carbamate kinase [Thermoproteota archaeon]|jgi:carbamate kinase
MKKLVIAIGGNAIELPYQETNINEKLRNINIVCKQIAELIKRGYKVLITHGNGPQIGNLLLQQMKTKVKRSLSEITAITQAEIGYFIQQSILNFLNDAKVATVITQVLVDMNDPAFKDPTKPIGPLFTENEIKEIASMLNYQYKKVSVKNLEGYRLVVPSPKPIKIIEENIIRNLVENDVIVIAGGGGGIPVILKNGKYEGVDAVIDKDLTAELLARIIKAELLLIVTNVEKVKINFRKPNEKDLDTIKLNEAIKYMEEGHFEEGSMKPKIQACINFLEGGGEIAIITSMEKILEAIEGKAGTMIVK